MWESFLLKFILQVLRFCIIITSIVILNLIFQNFFVIISCQCEVYSLNPPGLRGINPPGIWGIDPHTLGDWGRGSEFFFWIFKFQIAFWTFFKYTPWPPSPVHKGLIPLNQVMGVGGSTPLGVEGLNPLDQVMGVEGVNDFSSICLQRLVFCTAQLNITSRYGRPR